MKQFYNKIPGYGGILTGHLLPMILHFTVLDSFFSSPSTGVEGLTNIT